MAEDSTMLIPDFTMDKLRCVVCGGYLSSAPILVLPDGSCTCGQCSLPNSDLPLSKGTALEAILCNALLPCRFKRNGCMQRVRFGQAAEHESKCIHRSIPCPLLNLLNCQWSGVEAQMVDHFSRKHPQLLMRSSSFKLQTDQDAQQIFGILKDNVFFVVKYCYDAACACLKYDIRYLLSHRVHGASFVLELSDDSNDEGNMSLKRTPCSVYNITFQNIAHSRTLNLKEFLESLDKPTCISVSIRWFLECGDSTEDDVNDSGRFLESLKCKNCYHYLTLPMYELQDNTICSKCANKYPESRPFFNQILVRLITDTAVPCFWRECKYTATSNNMLKHEAECEFRPFRCLWTGCEDQYALAKAADHYAKAHGIQYSPDQLSFKIQFYFGYPKTYLLYVKKDVVVLLKHHIWVDYAKGTRALYMALLATDNLYGKVKLQHQHCFKNIEFPIETNTKEDLKIAFDKLPGCYRLEDEVKVTVDI